MSTVESKLTGARFVAPAVRDLPPSGIRRFFDLVATTPGVISLGVGEPDFPTPARARATAVREIRAGHTRYTANSGALPLRRAIAGYLDGWLRLGYSPDDEILVTVGAAEAVDLALRATVAPGDEVLIPSPSFVSYGPLTILAGGRPRYVQTRAEDDWKLTADALRQAITPRSRTLLLGFPANPTGAVMNRRELATVAAVAAEHDLLIITDEIYGELTFSGEHTSLASLPGMWERTIFVSGFSKAYCMTGWRVGYACGPAAVIGAMQRIHQYTIMSAPTTGQMAALAALADGRRSPRRLRAAFRRRRDVVREGLADAGLPCAGLEGAFYAFPRVGHLGVDDVTFAEGLLHEEAVAVVPGSAFGPGGEGHVRLAYTQDEAVLKTALERIGQYCRRLAGHSQMF